MEGSAADPIASDDQELVAVVETGLGCVRVADDKLLHRCVPERASDGEHACKQASKNRVSSRTRQPGKKEDRQGTNR